MIFTVTPGDFVWLPAVFVGLAGQQNEDACVVVLEANGKRRAVCVLADTLLPTGRLSLMNGLAASLSNALDCLSEAANIIRPTFPGQAERFDAAVLGFVKRRRAV